MENGVQTAIGGRVSGGNDPMSVPGSTPAPGEPSAAVFERPAAVAGAAAGIAAPVANPGLALIERMAARDEAALAEFYEQCVSTVFGLVLRITRLRTLAEEVVADSFLQVWQQAARYDPARGRPLAWVLTIARSRAIDALRRADPAETVDDAASLADQQAQSLSGSHGASGDRDGPQDPLAALDTWQRDSALHEAMSALAPVQRQVIALAYFRGLSQSEIAAHLAMPLGTVKSHVRFALQALRGLLGAPGAADAERGDE